MEDGRIIRPDLITEDALTWGDEYVKYIQKAIDITIKFSEVAKKFSTVKTEKELIDLQKKQITLSKEASNALIQLEKATQAAINTTAKKNESASKSRINSEKEKQAEIKTTLQLDSKAAKNIQDQEKSKRSLIQTQKAEIQLSEVQRRQKEAVEKSTERERRATEKLSSAYAQLSAKRTQARKVIEDLNAKKALGIKLSDAEQKELNQTTKEYKKYEGQIRKIDQLNGKFQANVGNYPKIFSSARSALVGFIGAFGLFKGVNFFADFTRESYTLANQATGVEFAFNRIGIAAEKSFNKVKEATNGLISDLDIKKSIVQFNNFGLSIEKLDTLSKFLAVTSTQTGQSFENLRDSLIEGISKKSTQRIDNLGISVNELNEELKKTPVFIDAVANIAERRIKTAGNILEDATDTQQQWRVSVENTSISYGKLINTIINGNAPTSKSLRFLVDAFGFFFETIDNKLKPDQQIINEAAAERAKKVLGLINESVEKYKTTLEEAADEGISRELKIIEEINKELEENIKKQETRAKQIKESATFFKSGTSEIKEGKIELQLTTDELEKEKAIYEKSVQLIKALVEQEKLRNLEALKPKEISEDDQKKIDDRIKNEKTAALELEKFRRDVEIKRLDEQINNETKTLDERLKLIAEKAQKEIELASYVSQKTIEIEKLKGNERKLIEEKAIDEISKIGFEKTAESFKLQLDQLQKFEDERKRLERQEVATVLTVAGDDPEKIKKAEEIIKQIKIQSAADVFNKKIEFLEKLLNQEGLTSEQIKVIDDELTKIKLENLELLNEEAEKRSEDQIKLLEKQQEKIRSIFEQSANTISNSLNLSSSTNLLNIFDGLTTKLEEGETKLERFAEVAQNAFSVVGDILNNVFDNNIRNIEFEIQANENKYNKQIELAKDNELQVSLLELERERKRSELEKKKKKEQEKQAKIAKALAALNIIFSTGQAVLAAFMPPPTGLGPLIGAPLAAATAAFGAAQLALVLAQPIPKFKDGVINFSGGAAILGDGGRSEVVTDRYKNILTITPAKDTLYNLPIGANVYSSVGDFAKKEGLMDNALRASILSSVHGDNFGFNISQLTNAFDRNFNDLEKNIQSGIDKGFKKINFKIMNNINVDNSYSNYKKSLLS